MRVQGNDILLRYDEIVPEVVSKANWNNLKTRGHITTTCIGGNGRRVEVYYSSLPAKYQRKVTEKFGDLKEYIAKQSLLQLMPAHLPDEWQGLHKYRLPNGLGLPDKHIQSYYTACIYLAGVRKLADRACLKTIQMTRADALAAFCQLIKVNDISLPTHARRLAEKAELFADKGFHAVISAKWCNANAEKPDNAAEAWLCDQYASASMTIEMLFEMYNDEAPKRGWKQIKSLTTLRDRLNKPYNMRRWMPERQGQSAANNKLLPQIKTRGASAPHELWISDGTGLNYQLQNSNQLIMYAIIDAYSEAIMGWTVSEGEGHETIVKAARMALNATGRRPLDWRYDNGSGNRKAETQAFFTAAAVGHHAAAVKNAKGKSIEQVFGCFQRKVQRARWFWNGQNRTAKDENSHQNMDFLAENRTHLPLKSDVMAIVAEDVAKWNAMPHPKTGRPRSEMLNDTTAAPEFTLEDRISAFWLTTDKTIRYRNSGLTMQIGGHKRHYEVMSGGLPDMDFYREHLNADVRVKYDPDDLSVVMLYTERADGSLQFIAEAREKTAYSYTKAGMMPGEMSEVQKHLAQRKEEQKKLEAERSKRKPVDPFVTTQDSYWKENELPRAALKIEENQEAAEIPPERFSIFSRPASGQRIE